MRRRNKHRALLAHESSSPEVADVAEVEVTTPVPWNVDQLNALGPLIGPGHRTSVPIVRGSLPDSTLGVTIDSSAP